MGMMSVQAGAFVGQRRAEEGIGAELPLAI